ncbi:similar to Saccharomyces cerevisiae YJL186W MNN5 Alpha-1,2-mannosyltransferase [Maudiozyma saulgeensis]|uniref:Similar to Saccharomyces cerevisiae YJL186W MNN5 Alpha-1,2-mannosyltransferase n=1 Tax=Maudiozyma saulgeensis TaxID=1789683 RepID=A0A1X7R781_9SACH|nr:similar to Saccharomyces cerevisiae YJL186W MNN5 Alpha-1,2-mannosyltransferase [Kazachstania saulgeensis]
MLYFRHMRRAGRFTVIIVCLTIIYYLYSVFHEQSLHGYKHNNTFSKNVSYVFYNKLFESIDYFKPMDPPEKNRMLMNSFTCKKVGNYGLNDVKKFNHLTFYHLNECYHLDDDQFNNLHQTHNGFMKEIVEQFPNNIINNLNIKGKGIVTVGGGRYSVLLITMLETLRHSGTTLPVEVFIPPKDEGDDEFCNIFLPKLNAKCVYFKDILPSNIVDNIEVKSYQIKAMALVLSTFKDIIFLDADNFAMKNLDNVFDSTIYKETGLVIWPDLWRRFTAPIYYKIADIPYNKDKRVRYSFDDVSPVSRYEKDPTNIDSTSKDSKIPFHDLEGTIADPASESGQMLINKEKHLHTLLLALYYNIYGPMWYYFMFSQGTAGEGDKETFISAAHALNLPYYQVRTPLAFDGFHHDVKMFQGLGLLQHDFIQDYQLHQDLQKLVSENPEKYSKFDPDYDLDITYKKHMLQTQGEKHDDSVDVMFLHASFYKFDAWSLYDQKCFLLGSGEHTRGYTNQRRYGGFDFELFNFKALQNQLCNKDESLRHRDFRYLNEKVSEEDWPKLCAYIDDHVEYLNNTPLPTNK